MGHTKDGGAGAPEVGFAEPAYEASPVRCELIRRKINHPPRALSEAAYLLEVGLLASRMPAQTVKVCR